MLTTQLEFIEKFNLPAQKPEAAIIWLHGLGADCNDFVPLVPELNLSIATKFIFPNAPVRPITINKGYKMRAWYDIIEFNMKRENVDENGILTSVKQIEGLIELQLNAGFKSEQIILAGFSQGGAISYITMLLSQYKLGGVIALSTYLPDLSVINLHNSKNLTTPIFAAHGRDDTVIPYQVGIAAYEQLKNAGFTINLHSYSMAHSVCPEEIKDLANWLERVQIRS